MRIPLLRRRARILRGLRRETATLRERLAALERRDEARQRTEAALAGAAAVGDARRAIGSAFSRLPGPPPFDPGRIVEVETEYGALLAPAWDRVITPVLRAGRPWEPVEAAFLESRLFPGATYLDVGAHVGCHAVRAARRCGSRGRVVAIEAEPRNHAMLAANLRRHAPGTAVAVWAAAGEASGTAELGIDGENAGDHRLYPHAGRVATVSVPVVALDEVWPRDADLDVVKIDVQGVDHRVVRGMQELLERTRPVLLVEFWPEGIREAGDEPRKVLEGYRSLSYRVTLLERPDLAPDAPTQSLVRAAEENEGGYVSLALVPAVA